MLVRLESTAEMEAVYDYREDGSSIEFNQQIQDLKILKQNLLQLLPTKQEHQESIVNQMKENIFFARQEILFLFELIQKTLSTRDDMQYLQENGKLGLTEPPRTWPTGTNHEHLSFVLAQKERDQDYLIQTLRDAKQRLEEAVAKDASFIGNIAYEMVRNNWILLPRGSGVLYIDYGFHHVGSRTSQMGQADLWRDPDTNTVQLITPHNKLMAAQIGLQTNGQLKWLPYYKSPMSSLEEIELLSVARSCIYEQEVFELLSNETASDQRFSAMSRMSADSVKIALECGAVLVCRLVPMTSTLQQEHQSVPWIENYLNLLARFQLQKIHAENVNGRSKKRLLPLLVETVNRLDRLDKIKGLYKRIYKMTHMLFPVQMRQDGFKYTIAISTFLEMILDVENGYSIEASNKRQQFTSVHDLEQFISVLLRKSLHTVVSGEIHKMYEAKQMPVTQIHRYHYQLDNGKSYFTS
ncbi:hypothetical protein EDD86DRAFT_202577 [Gorgonomyces haynaldii]|nr:hypothetical protein EDD86DRAFT_202577 [Gorgonomyces haynaldii]